jgi:hypothetical protein
VSIPSQEGERSCVCGIECAVLLHVNGAFQFFLL